MPEPGLVRVIAAVVERDGRWLLGQRPAHKRHGGLWEFPGGKVDDGETSLDAARRELDEELRLEAVAAGDTLYRVRDGDSSFLIEFVEVEVRGAATAREHSEIGWFDLAELAELPLAPADRAFVRWLSGERRQGVACDR